MLPPSKTVLGGRTAFCRLDAVAIGGAVVAMMRPIPARF
jgi:hypothetical protein